MGTDANPRRAGGRTGGGNKAEDVREPQYSRANIDEEGLSSTDVTDGRELIAKIIERPDGHFELAVICRGALVEVGRYRTRRAAIAAASTSTRARL